MLTPTVCITSYSRGTPLKSETELNCSKNVRENGVKRLAWVGDSIVLWRRIGKKVDVA